MGGNRVGGLVAAGAGLACLAAACGGGSGGHGSALSPTTSKASTATPPPTGAPVAGRSGWVRSDLKPVSQPVAVAGVFVVYVSTANGLALVGLDAGDGRTLWQDPASPGSITPGVAPELTVADAMVVYLKPGNPASAELVAANPRTGAQAWSSPPAMFTSWPELCPVLRARLGEDVGGRSGRGSCGPTRGGGRRGVGRQCVALARIGGTV